MKSARVAEIDPLPRNVVKKAGRALDWTEPVDCGVEQVRPNVIMQPATRSIRFLAPADLPIVTQPFPAIVLDAQVKRLADLAYYDATAQFLDIPKLLIET
jgi:hypothetical protein